MCEQNKTETRKLKIFISHFAKLRIYYLSYLIHFFLQSTLEGAMCCPNSSPVQEKIHSLCSCLVQRANIGTLARETGAILICFQASRVKREVSVKKAALGTRPTQGEEHEKLNPSICQYLASHKFHPLAKELNTKSQYLFHTIVPRSAYLDLSLNK